MAASDGPSSLLRRLDALPPRAAGLLERAVVEAIPIPELVTRMGVSEDALAVSLWRAAVAFSESPAPIEGDEGACARALVAALSGGGELPAGATDLQALRNHASAVFELFEARDAFRTRFELWVRCALALLLICLALWLSH